MNSRLATVNKLLTWSTVDGPGNRLVVFLQGCNFACSACHNPYTIGICDHCGDCIDVCEPGALAMQDGRIAFDPELCTDCDDCLTACPISASPMTRQMRVDDILDIARQNSAFLSGITVSGGEATLQLKFVQDLFTAIAADKDLCHLTRFIDTNGHLGPKGWSKLLPVTDGVMLDIKGFDPALHKRLTGKKGDKALHSALLLHQAGKLYELRYLLSPGQTDGPDEIAALQAFAASLGDDIRIRLNAFQHHGVRGEALNWPTMQRDGVEKIAAQLREAGVAQVITPALYQ